MAAAKGDSRRVSRAKAQATSSVWTVKISSVFRASGGTCDPLSPPVLRTRPVRLVSVSVPSQPPKPGSLKCGWRMPRTRP